MSKLVYSQKVEGCASINLLWSESTPGVPNGYCRPPGLHRSRNWAGSPLCRLPRNQSSETKLQTFPSKAPNPEQDQLSGLGRNQRERERDRVLLHPTSSSAAHLSSLLCHQNTTQKVLLHWCIYYSVSLRWPCPSMSGMQSNNIATKPTPDSRRG